MKKQWIEGFVNLVFWATSAWLLLAGFSVVSIEHTIENGEESQLIVRDSLLLVKIGAAIILSIVLFYSNIYLINSLRTRRSNWQIVAYSLGAFLLSLMLYQLFIIVKVLPVLPPLPLSLRLGIFTFYYAISIAYALSMSWLRLEAERQQLIIAKNQAELSVLRNQLQPHFLFNALNNLLFLISNKQYQGATDSIEKLAQLLRYVVDEIRTERVPLAREIQFIENYTALQMLRYEPEEVSLDFSVVGDPGGVLVEPGLFLPFVENAFKHGTEPETNSEITIAFVISPAGTIDFSVRNPIKGMHSYRAGTGLTATRNRLALAYADRHQLDISKEADFRVHLKLQPA